MATGSVGSISFRLQDGHDLGLLQAQGGTTYTGDIRNNSAVLGCYNVGGENLEIPPHGRPLHFEDVPVVSVNTLRGNWSGDITFRSVYREP